ncbi:hypothetical protein [Gracilinema caldarium]|uniref:hypothetical protein n=1 Tax=Gracilinema caldarium TaxID=215591 RepID=UPI0026EBB1DE|nr:hypothetical protein [Gracilinema caldarium]
MKRRLMYTALMVISLLALSCNQSPLFYNISKETPPKDPVIAGGPSRIVASNVSSHDRLYTANGKIWVYDGSSWIALENQPGGNIREVAATSTALYALSVDGTGSISTTLYKTTDGTNWAPVTNSTNYSILGAIFGAGATLFVGARNSGGTEAAVLYDNGGNLATALSSITVSDSVPGSLVGAVNMGGNYYLAVTGKGIYTAALASNFHSATPISGSTDTKYRLNGLIALATEVVAVGSGGYMLKGSSGGFSEVSAASDTSYPYTGALAVWTDETSSLLLAGRRYSTYTNGYWELPLTSGDLPSTVSIKVPGDGSPTTVADKTTYQQSLGQKIVSALYQAPASLGSTLFASTLTDGLWAYRGSWNAEE